MVDDLNSQIYFKNRLRFFWSQNVAVRCSLEDSELFTGMCVVVSSDHTANCQSSYKIPKKRCVFFPELNTIIYEFDCSREWTSMNHTYLKYTSKLC